MWDIILENNRPHTSNHHGRDIAQVVVLPPGMCLLLPDGILCEASSPSKTTRPHREPLWDVALRLLLINYTQEPWRKVDFVLGTL